MQVIDRYISFIKSFPVASISDLSVLIPITILLFSRGKEKPLLIFFYYLIAQLIFNLIGIHLASQTENTLWLCNLWYLISLIWLSCLFKAVFINEKERLAVSYISIVYTAVFILDVIYSNPILSDIHNHAYTCIIPTLYCFLVMGYCLYFFLETPEVDSILIWLIASLLFYNSISIVATAFYNFFMVWNDEMGLMTVIYVPYLAFLGSMMIFSFGLIKCRKTSLNFIG